MLNEVLVEDKKIPYLERDITVALERIKQDRHANRDNFDLMRKHIEKQHEELTALHRWKAETNGSIRTLKWVFGISLSMFGLWIAINSLPHDAMLKVFGGLVA